MDKASGLTPLYMQLREIIRYKIETGEFAPCTALPSENELADEYAVTRQTVSNAIETLVNEGLRRPERFSGIASLSGALNYPRIARQVMNGQWPDLLPQELRALHGATCLPSEEEDAISLVCRQAGNPQRPRLIQLCGTSDFLYEDNQTFRRAAEKAGYGHMYLEAPGDHEWPYWDKAIQYAFQFFRNMDMKTTPIY